MRKTFLIGIGATAALVAAAAAMAAVFTATGVSTTTATLTSTQATDVRTRTCTGADNKTFMVTDGRYAGVATFTDSATALNGPLSIRARTTVDKASSLGYVEGSFSVKDDQTRLSGRFSGTLDATGKLAGFLTGATRGGNARVLGSLSGQFAPATGFVGNGLLGSAPSSAAFAVVSGPVCKGKPSAPPKPKRLSITGTLALGSGTVSVTRGDRFKATCSVDATYPLPAGFAANDKVEMKCENAGSGWLLRGLTKITPPTPKPKRLEIKGTLSLGQGTVSVTRNGLTATCTVDSTYPLPSGFAANDKVEMKCENAGSGWLLRLLKKNT
jgi:hypothetical protein